MALARGVTGDPAAAWADAVHGGTDALGAPLHDFSTNSNACGPCPVAVAALQQADATRYPDPHYTALRAQLGAFHGVDAARIVVAGSASEFIHRITAWAVRRGACTVALPAHAYGDYARAAAAWGLQAGVHPAGADLQWACEPSSPLGQRDASLHDGAWTTQRPFALRVLDCAYAPLRLHDTHGEVTAPVWQLWTPNKALGLTGVRAAYAVAPVDASAAELALLRGLAPSWPVGAHGVALLQAWAQPATQRWLAESLVTLRNWKAQQQALCASLGWAVCAGSLANYFVARPNATDLPAALHALRAQGIKLRDCASFGLPGHVRLGVLAPAAQQALRESWPGAALI